MRGGGEGLFLEGLFLEGLGFDLDERVGEDDDGFGERLLDGPEIGVTVPAFPTLMPDPNPDPEPDPPPTVPLTADREYVDIPCPSLPPSSLTSSSSSSSSSFLATAATVDFHLVLPPAPAPSGPICS